MPRKRPAKPFDPTYPVNLNMLPVLSLQTSLRENQMMFSFRGRVSEPISEGSPTGGAVETELGGSIRQDDVNRRYTKVEYGSLHPDDGHRFTQREIYNDIISEVTVPDVVIGERGLIFDVPKKFEDREAFQGADELYHEETKSGNRTRKLRKLTNLPLKNPYHIIRGELLERDFVQSKSDPLLRRIRSVLKTNYLIPNNTKGYYNVELVPLLRQLRRGNWWEDTGIPKKMVGDIDSGTFQGVVMQSDRRPNCLFGI